MSTPAGIIGSRLTTGVGETASFAGGVAIAPTLAPVLRDLENVTWSLHPDKRLDLLLAAEVVAEDVDMLGPMQDEVKQSGWDETRLAWAYGVTLNAPGTGQLLSMLNRKTINPGNFTHGLRKARLEPLWDDALTELKTQRIGIGDLAYMLVRDLIPNPFGGQGPASADDNTINDIGVVAIDPVKEAADQGWSQDQLEAFYGRSGLAPAPVTAANAYFRGIADYEQFKTMIAKGDLRPAYANVILNTSRQILTADQYLEGALRGWTSLKDGMDGAAKHGMSPEDATLLYQIRRRPLNPHTITEALAKGGVFQPVAGEIQDPYVASVHQADLGPEWYDLAEAMKYSPPSLFVIRQLLKDGVYTQDHAAQRIRQLGIFPEDADLIAAAYAPTQAAAADPHVTKAQNQLWTTTHAAYKAAEIDDATATNAMGAAGVGAAAVPAVLDIWREERALTRKQLSPSQVKKAASEGLMTPADALAALTARGYSQQDATTFLSE